MYWTIGHRIKVWTGSIRLSDIILTKNHQLPSSAVIRNIARTQAYIHFRDVCGRPENFFKECFVYNHCPLAFMTASGKNVTPPELRSTHTKDLKSNILSLCDEALLEICRLLRVEVVICVGKFAHARATFLKKQHQLEVRVVFLMHPSPINPVANRGWKEIAQRALEEADVLKDLVGS
jgi:single-strand selective monofunctional uracil DNA glycosylase